MYLGGAISESTDLDTGIKCRIGAAWASVRKYNSQLYNRRNARLSLKIRLFKAEVMEVMLYGCATWTMRSQDLSNLRTAHHKLLLRIIGFRRKDRTGYKLLSYREVLERTVSERIETTFGSANLDPPGPLSGKATQGSQSESCLGGWRCKVSRNGFGSPVPRQSAHHLYTRAEFGAYLRDSSRVPRRRPFIYLKLPYAIGSVPSLSGHAIAYRWRSLPRVRRDGACKPQGSSERVLPWQITMDLLICASLSHTHYWYEVGMLKVPVPGIGMY